MFYTDFGVRLLYLYSVYVTIVLRRTRKMALKGRTRTSTWFIWILEYVFYTLTLLYMGAKNYTNIWGGVNLPHQIEMSLCAPEGGAVICNWVFMMY